MTWKQRKTAARARALVRKLGRDRRVGGLAAAIAYKASAKPKTLKLRAGLRYENGVLIVA